MASDDIELQTPTSMRNVSDESVESAKHRAPLLHYLSLILAAAIFVFIAGYDFTASAAALPIIGIRFSKLSTVNWVVVAYMIPFASLMPSVNKLAAVCGYRVALAVFVLLHIAGSVMSGATQGMPLLLAGRVIAGLGASGSTIISLTAVEETGSKGQRMFGLRILLVTWLVGSVIGLAAGGCLAKWSSWRWIFYFDIPFVVVALALSIFAIRIPKHEGSKLQMLKSIDALGTMFVAGSVVTLALALNYGGNLFKWSSGVVITLLILSVFLFIVFVFIEVKLASEPIMPSSMFKTRTSTALLAIQPFVGIVTFAPIVYLIMWYDAVKSQSSEATCVRILAVTLFALAVALIVEIVVSISKRCRPLVHISVPFMTLGCGLLIILNENTNRNVPVAFMALLGVGIGLSFQPHFIMIHGASVAKTMTSVVAAVLFLRILGAAVGIALFNAVLQNNLVTKLAAVVLQHPLYAVYILNSVDNSDVMRLPRVPQSVRSAVVDANAQGFRSIFIACTAFAAVAIPLLVFVGRRQR